MNKKDTLQFKLSFLKSSLISCGLTNCIFNGFFYFLFNRTTGNKTAAGFVINAAITAFVLSLICAGFAALTMSAKHKKERFHQVPTRETDIF